MLRCEDQEQDSLTCIHKPCVLSTQLQRVIEEKTELESELALKLQEIDKLKEELGVKQYSNHPGCHRSH